VYVGDVGNLLRIPGAPPLPYNVNNVNNINNNNNNKNKKKSKKKKKKKKKKKDRRRRHRRRRLVYFFPTAPLLRPFLPPPLSSSAHRNRIQRWMQTPCHHVTWPMATMATTNCYLNATLDWVGVGGSGWEWVGVGGSGWEPELKDLPMKEMADGKKDARFWLQ